VGYLERLVVLTAPQRGAAILLHRISSNSARLNCCDPTVGLHGIYARAARRCSVILVLRQEVTMMVARKNQAALDEAMCAYLARSIVLHCMRNTRLEDLHAGVYPDSATGDYTDVKVVSPYGEIPWNKASRISDAEMRSLMRHCVNRVYTYLLHLETSRGFKFDCHWDPPELDLEMMKDIEAIKAEDAINISGMRGKSNKEFGKCEGT
jgi:hypothetical protein